MKEFKDKDGGRWKIDLPFGEIVRIKSQSSGRFNLLEPNEKPGGGEQTLTMLLDSDLAEFWELLWLVVEPQATAKGVSPAQFGELMAADCLITAQAAFFDEWRDFFRLLRRPDQAAALEKLAKYREAALEAVTERLTDPRLKAIDAKATNRIQAESKRLFSDLLDRAESSLGDTPGDNSTGSRKASKKATAIG